MDAIGSLVRSTPSAVAECRACDTLSRTFTFTYRRAKQQHCAVNVACNLESDSTPNAGDCCSQEIKKALTRLEGIANKVLPKVT